MESGLAVKFDPENLRESRCAKVALSGSGGGGGMQGKVVNQFVLFWHGQCFAL
jgi:hypothetical protein